MSQFPRGGAAAQRAGPGRLRQYRLLIMNAELMRIAKVEASLELAEPETHDRAPWDWYAQSCPCGVPAGSCRLHPRARPAQRPPAGNWRTWLALAGRGWGKTRCGGEWIRNLVETAQARRVALVAPTAADVRDVMVEGESGLLAISPPWFRPRYEPSKRRLTWPNRAIATLFTADEPERLRGPQHDAAWCDEIACWRYPAAFDMLLLGLRLGSNPRVCVTTTPRANSLVKRVVEAPTTKKTGGTTYENSAHLAPEFISQITAMFEGTRLGRQELHAELLEIVEGQWFASFDPAIHVTAEATYSPMFPARLAIDCGTSQHTGAVFFQVRQLDEFHKRISVFGDFYTHGSYSAKAAAQVKAKADELTGGRLEVVRVDPAASAQTGVGPTAYAEYERVFGSRVLGRWPIHPVVDGLDQVEILLDSGCLLIHPRCKHLIAAFQNYRRARRGGEILDYPEDPQNPHEDLMDALRGGIRDVFPEGRRVLPALSTVRAARLF
jgi:phage terminase large subunit-like protein